MAETCPICIMTTASPVNVDFAAMSDDQLDQYARYMIDSIAAADDAHRSGTTQPLHSATTVDLCISIVQRGCGGCGFASCVRCRIANDITETYAGIAEEMAAMNVRQPSQVEAVVEDLVRRTCTSHERFAMALRRIMSANRSLAAEHTH